MVRKKGPIANHKAHTFMDDVTQYDKRQKTHGVLMQISHNQMKIILLLIQTKKPGDSR